MKQKIAVWVSLAVILVSVLAWRSSVSESVGVLTSPGQNGGTWFAYNDFGGGYQTKLDAQKITDNASPQGQNTTANEGDRISVRNAGYDLVPSTGTLDSSGTPINTLHTFRRRSGENILMRTTGPNVEYFEEANDVWEVLATNYATSTDYGFADFNINTDLHSYTYFGNGVNNGSRWSGDHTLLTTAVSAATSSLAVTDTTGFAASGDVVYCGISQAYTSVTPTYIVLSAPAHTCASGRSAASAISTDASAPKGNIYLNANNRLFISGVASSTQAVFFSVYGNAGSWGSTLVADGTDTAAGIFNLGEGGGGVVAAVLDEESIYFLKKSITYRATLTDTLYTIVPLKSFDGKGQTSGATSNKSTVTGGNSVYFVTPDKQIMGLTRVEQIDFPQNVPISDVIKPTAAAANFASSTAVVFQDKLYMAARSTDAAPVNDTVFVYDIRNGFWDTPIVGWSVADWTVYDDGAGEKLYFGDANSANVYEVTTQPNDYSFGISANWRTKNYDFGSPQTLKQVDNFYVDGYISPNTTLTVSFLLDENGVTQMYRANIVGTETGFIFSSPSYNVFGFLPFGTERFGTQDDVSGKRRFRVYLNKGMVATPFYVAQVEFASDGENQQWEILNYAFNVRPFSQGVKPSLFREWR